MEYHHSCPRSHTYFVCRMFCPPIKTRRLLCAYISEGVEDWLIARVATDRWCQIGPLHGNFPSLSAITFCLSSPFSLSLFSFPLFLLSLFYSYPTNRHQPYYSSIHIQSILLLLIWIYQEQGQGQIPSYGSISLFNRSKLPTTTTRSPSARGTGSASSLSSSRILSWAMRLV